MEPSFALLRFVMEQQKSGPEVGIALHVIGGHASVKRSPVFCVQAFESRKSLSGG